MEHIDAGALALQLLSPREKLRDVVITESGTRRAVQKESTHHSGTVKSTDKMHEIMRK